MTRYLPIVILCALAGCTTPQRYTGIAATCEAYAVALNTAAALNRDGRLSRAAQDRIDITIPPARAICTGVAPTDDPEAVRKVADAVIAILKEAGQ